MWHGDGTVVKKGTTMATIRQRGASFHVQVRIKGYLTQTASFKRLTDARRWAHRTESDLREGRHFPGSIAKRHTVGDLLDRYCESVLSQKAFNTPISQRPQLLWWKERIGHLSLCDVTPAVIAENRDVLTQIFKTSTVNRYLATLSHTFTMAIREWGWVDSNPSINVTRPPGTQLRIRFLDDNERRRLLAACKESRNQHLYTVVVLALSTGARKMELLSLRWPDVDLRRGMITLHDTKNKECRALPLTGRALELMREHVRVRRLDTNLVFPNQDGTAPAEIKTAWQIARNKAEITNFRFHDLRHSCASYLAMNGASLAEIAEVLGHKTLGMVKRYAHLSEKHTAGVVARMNARI